GMVSFITPPVALATFAAAPLAGVSAMRIGLQSIRLGTAIYIVPFCFVLNPALLLKGDPADVALNVSLAFAGIIVSAAALQGYVLGIGRIPRDIAGYFARALMIGGGILLAVPSPRLTGFSFTINVAAGATAAVVALLMIFALIRKTEKGRILP
ncbi:MAG: TRAP transporter large permease subunit, partial [Pseudolabrys sp.]